MMEINGDVVCVVSPQEAKRFSCHLCAYTTNYKAHLNVHILTHSAERNFRCDQCDYSGKTANTLRNHKKMVHSTEIHQCPQCDFTTKNYISVRLHIKNRHMDASELKLWKCDICGFETKHLNSLKCHKMTHFDEKPYKCDICDFITKHAASLRYHKTSVHMKVRNYECKKCDFRASNISNLRQHEWTHNAPGKYECEVCHEVLKNHRILKVHMRNRHSGMKPYICPSCGRAFSNSHNMKRHQRIHGPKNNEFKCALCPGTFSFIENLRRHMKFIHGGMDKPQCKDCGKKFYGKANLLRHIETVHDKKRNYICPVCNKSYSSPECLKRHLIIHDLKEDIDRPESMEGLAQFISGIPRRKYVSIVQKIRQQQTDHKLIHTPFVCVYQMPYYLTEEENETLFQTNSISLNSQLMQKIAKLPHKDKTVSQYYASQKRPKYYGDRKPRVEAMLRGHLLANGAIVNQKTAAAAAGVVNGVHIIGEPVPNLTANETKPKVFGTLEPNLKDHLEHTVYVKVEVSDEHYDQMTTGNKYTTIAMEVSQTPETPEVNSEFDLSNVIIKEEVTDDSYNEAILDCNEAIPTLLLSNQKFKGKKGGKKVGKVNLASLLNKKAAKKGKVNGDNQAKITKTMKEKKKRATKEKSAPAGSGVEKIKAKVGRKKKNNDINNLANQEKLKKSGKAKKPVKTPSKKKSTAGNKNENAIVFGEQGFLLLKSDGTILNPEASVNSEFAGLKSGPKEKKVRKKKAPKKLPKTDATMNKNLEIGAIEISDSPDVDHMQSKTSTVGSDIVNNNKPMSLRDIFLSTLPHQSSDTYGSLNPQELFPEVDLTNTSEEMSAESVKLENLHVVSSEKEMDGVLSKQKGKVTENKNSNVWNKILGMVHGKESSESGHNNDAEVETINGDEIVNVTEKSSEVKRSRKQPSPNKRGPKDDDQIDKQTAADPVVEVTKSGRKRRLKSLGWDFVSDPKDYEKQMRSTNSGEIQEEVIAASTVPSKKRTESTNKSKDLTNKKEATNPKRNKTSKKLKSKNETVTKKSQQKTKGNKEKSETNAMYIQWIVRKPEEEQLVNDTVVLNTRITDMDQDVQVQLVSDPIQDDPSKTEGGGLQFEQQSCIIRDQANNKKKKMKKQKKSILNFNLSDGGCNQQYNSLATGKHVNQKSASDFNSNAIGGQFIQENPALSNFVSNAAMYGQFNLQNQATSNSSVFPGQFIQPIPVTSLQTVNNPMSGAQLQFLPNPVPNTDFLIKPPKGKAKKINKAKSAMKNNVFLGNNGAFYPNPLMIEPFNHQNQGHLNTDMSKNSSKNKKTDNKVTKPRKPSVAKKPKAKKSAISVNTAGHGPMVNNPNINSAIQLQSTTELVQPVDPNTVQNICLPSGFMNSVDGHCSSLPPNSLSSNVQTADNISVNDTNDNIKVSVKSDETKPIFNDYSPLLLNGAVFQSNCELNEHDEASSTFLNDNVLPINKDEKLEQHSNRDYSTISIAALNDESKSLNSDVVPSSNSDEKDAPILNVQQHSIIDSPTNNNSLCKSLSSLNSSSSLLEKVKTEFINEDPNTLIVAFGENGEIIALPQSGEISSDDGVGVNVYDSSDVINDVQLGDNRGYIPQFEGVDGSFMAAQILQ